MGNSFLSPAGVQALVGPNDRQNIPNSILATAFTNIPFQFSPPPDQAIQTMINTPNGAPLVYPVDLQTSRYWMQFDINTYQRASWNAVGTGTPLGTVFLPLAEQLVDSATVSYETTPMGTLAGSLMNIHNMPPPSQAVDAIKKRLMALGFNFANEALGQFIGNLGGQNFSGALSAMAGFAVNDYMTVLLKGPTYKVREFSWHFSPRNDFETGMLMQILAAFKNAQAPSYAFSSSSAFFGWPNIFNISFQSSNPNAQMTTFNTPTNSPAGMMSLYQFLPAVLNDLVVNYTPNGPNFYGPTAAPVSYQVMMRFTELQFWLRNDYQSPTGVVWDNTIPTTTSVSPSVVTNVTSGATAGAAAGGFLGQITGLGGLGSTIGGAIGGAIGAIGGLL